MNPFLGLLQRDVDDWFGTLVFVVIFVLPLLARGLRKILVALGVLREEDPAAQAEQRRTLREERRRQEAEGEELWRRLARGEAEAAEPPPAPAPRSLLGPEGSPGEGRLTGDQVSGPEPALIEEPSLESEAERRLARGETDILDGLSRQFERALITKALERTAGRRIEAATLLGMGRNTITRKIQELGIEDDKSAPDC